MVNSGATPPRRRLSVEVRREELMDVCLRLIGTRDWDRVTMADIAAEAKISKALLYHYFSAKSDLYLATVRAAAAELSSVTRPDPTLHHRDRLRAALVAHVDWIDEHALAYRAVLQGGLSGDPHVQAVVEASRSEVVARVIDSTGIAGVAPQLRIALRGWVGFLEGACLDWLAHRDITKEALVHVVADNLPAVIRTGRA